MIAKILSIIYVLILSIIVSRIIYDTIGDSPFMDILNMSWWRALLIVICSIESYQSLAEFGSAKDKT
jgi:hypothetical protein